MSSIFDAFILIGGISSRFGSNKAFAAFDGKTLASRAAEMVERTASPKTVRFVVRSEEQFDAERLLSLGRGVVADLKPGFGAWSGLHTALAYSSTVWTFVLACDLPYASGDLINKLAGLTDDAVDAVVPRQPDGRLQPLCAFYRRDVVLKEVERQLADAGRLPRLAGITSALNTRILEEAEYSELPGSELFFVNINSISDLPATIAPN
ncbi:MAG TPA: molybdenum cofactor guanylyltransferase [Pyrinomonadaceae bacterium]|mgnify:CR=1 FL=1|nr:molybdenum cofactor guanylyltransferase [Acidobacteriota bacterium]HQZ97297.1 molybdenum cofactor guanylyltransferase [Pyrinomonadaceae bacterium]